MRWQKEKPERGGGVIVIGAIPCKVGNPGSSSGWIDPPPPPLHMVLWLSACSSNIPFIKRNDGCFPAQLISVWKLNRVPLVKLAWPRPSRLDSQVFLQCSRHQCSRPPQQRCRRIWRQLHRQFGGWRRLFSPLISREGLLFACKQDDAWFWRCWWFSLCAHLPGSYTRSEEFRSSEGWGRRGAAWKGRRAGL